MAKSSAKLSLDQVQHIAGLANLRLLARELADFQSKLSQTLDFVTQLNQIDTAKIPPTFHPTAATNRFRSDEVTPSLSQEAALSNAPKTYQGFFVAKITWT